MSLPKLDKYKNYISIGYNCSASILLNKLKLRTKAFPLDWVVSNPNWLLIYFKTQFKDYYLPAPNSKTNYLGQDFHWFETHKFQEANEAYCENNISNYKLSIYQDNCNKFKRRIKRLIDLLHSKESILFVYNAEYRINCERESPYEKNMILYEDAHYNNLIDLKNYFESNYPSSKIDILVIYINKKNKFKYEKKDKINIIYVNVSPKNHRLQLANILRDFF